MADQHSNEASCSAEASCSNSESTVELNIKTLDSHIYSFHVDKNMSVSAFKEKIANQIGVPVGQQRLIFRGKVLKDEHLLSDYHVDNGHTLHLVERQQAQPQTSSAETNANSGNNASAGMPRGRIGQISHSVVLGTFNVGDQGEGGATDLTRVIGAVLNSLGLGNQTTDNTAVGTPNSFPSNISGIAPQGNEAEAGRTNVEGQNQAGNQSQPGQSFMGQPFQFPLAGVSAPLPSIYTPIPDSLNTLSEFMTRMEGVFSQNGYQPSPSLSDAADQRPVEAPSNSRGLSTPETLSMVLRHAERLLSGQAVAALSHIAQRLEQDSGSTDPSVRNQIQTESAQLGLAMQHLGALLLELGRTILTLRMGQSPVEAVVNAGPAVYISPTGPNPIMVQPFPLQTNQLFNAGAVPQPNTGTLGPVGIIREVPRHLNIHIHAGTSAAPLVTAVGARTGSGEGAQAERTGSDGSSDPSTTRVLPVRSLIAAAVPSRPTAVAVAPVAAMSQPVMGVSSSSMPASASLSSVISEVNSHFRNLIDNNTLVGNPASSGQPEARDFQNSLAGNDEGNADMSDQATSINVEGAAETSESRMGSSTEMQYQKDQPESQQRSQNGAFSSNDGSSSLVEPSSSCPIKEPEFGGASKSNEKLDNSDGANDAPLGLGVGGLQPKRRNRQSKMQPKSGDTGPAAGPRHQSQQLGQQVLQSLASLGRSNQSPNANVAAARQMPQAPSSAMAGTPSSPLTSDGQMDVSGMMSQLLQTPALNGLLSGVAQQTGVGSPDVLKNMLQQFTQNPAMRNTVNQLTQQVDREDIRHMFTGTGGDRDGGLDFSRMLQQMMPVVSQVLGGGSVLSEPSQSLAPEQEGLFDARRVAARDSTHSQTYQVDQGIQEAVQQIARRAPATDVFRAVAENAVDSYGTGSHERLVDELCSNQALTDEFMETLRNDISRQLNGGSGFE